MKRAVIMGLLGLVLGCASAWAQTEEKADKSAKPGKESKAAEKDAGTTTLRIEIVAGDNDQAVDNASVYIRWMKERTFAKDRMMEMSTKTSRSGVASVPGIPRGKVQVQVIASGWKTFGQWYELDKAEQTIRIKLQKPPRWY